MKKNFKLFLMLGLVASIGFTACSEEEETPTPTPTPTDSSAVLTQASAVGIVWNFQGPNKGAYDLLNDTERGAAEAANLKDLVDQAFIDSTGVVYPKTLGTANGSLFVKASSTFDYATITENKAKAAFDAGTATSKTDVLVAGDVYIVKNARFTNNYVVVKILTVNLTPSDNLDNITFNYKK